MSNTKLFFGIPYPKLVVLPKEDGYVTGEYLYEFVRELGLKLTPINDKPLTSPEWQEIISETKNIFKSENMLSTLMFFGELASGNREGFDIATHNVLYDQLRIGTYGPLEALRNPNFISIKGGDTQYKIILMWMTARWIRAHSNVDKDRQGEFKMPHVFYIEHSSVKEIISAFEELFLSLLAIEPHLSATQAQ